MINVNLNVHGNKFSISGLPYGGFDVYEVSEDEYQRTSKRLITHRSTLVSCIRWLEEELGVDLNEPNC